MYLFDLAFWATFLYLLTQRTVQEFCSGENSSGWKQRPLLNFRLIGLFFFSHKKSDLILTYIMLTKEGRKWEKLYSTEILDLFKKIILVLGIFIRGLIQMVTDELPRGGKKSFQVSLTPLDIIHTLQNFFSVTLGKAKIYLACIPCTAF